MKGNEIETWTWIEVMDGSSLRHQFLFWKYHLKFRSLSSRQGTGFKVGESVQNCNTAMRKGGDTEGSQFCSSPSHTTVSAYSSYACPLDFRNDTVISEAKSLLYLLEKALENLLCEANDQVQNGSCVSEPTYSTVFLGWVAFNSWQLMEVPVFQGGFFNLLGITEAKGMYVYNFHIYLWCARVYVCIPWQAYGSQRTICESWFSLSMLSVSGIEFRL